MDFLQKVGTVVVLLGLGVLSVQSQEEVGKQKIGTLMCKGRNDIHSVFDSISSGGYQYTVTMKREFTTSTMIQFALDDKADVTLVDDSFAKLSNLRKNTYQISFTKPNYGVKFVVKSLTKAKIPYLEKVVINNAFVCTKPIKGVFDEYIVVHTDDVMTSSKISPTSCGRRQIDHTELIVNGETTKAGEWPWHAAIYRLDKYTIKYICGGTLISENFVLTAAHCVTVGGRSLLPETFSVGFGKLKLAGYNVGSQEREVHKIIVHELFSTKILDNDIALLKLESTVGFDDYTQPACLWNKETESLLNNEELYGTVVGWGFDQSDALSSRLQKAVLPKLSYETCVRSNPLFFSKVLSTKKFCAGFHNGTSPCNGDSGGGFMVFVPETTNNKHSGSWHVRGIVSSAVARNDALLCDPYQNVVFTDVAQYGTWIEKNIT